MNQQDYTANIHLTSEQVQSYGKAQSHGQVQSHGQIHFGGGQAQSHGQIQSHGQDQSESGQDQSRSERAQYSSTSMAVQLLKNKNNPREEIKPTDKERQKAELEKFLESIRRFNQINEEIKESYDKLDAKLKQGEADMRESLRKAEAKYFPDLEQSVDLDQSKDLDQSNELDRSKDSDLDSDSSEDFVYVKSLKQLRLDVKNVMKR